MSVRVNTDFDNGFLVNEENLLKIEDIILKRLSEMNIESSKYNVEIFRIDGTYIRESTVSEFFNEENATRNQIVEIRYIVESDEGKIEVEFNREVNNRGVRIQIISQNKNMAQLLTADLKVYIETEILVFKRKSFASMSINIIKILSYILMIITVLFMFISIKPIDSSVLDTAIKSSDINSKLNTLLEVERIKNPNSNILKILLVFMTLIMILGEPFLKQLDKIYPINIIHIGKEVSWYNRKRELQKNIFWVVIVGLSVSLIGGGLIWFLTSK